MKGGGRGQTGDVDVPQDLLDDERAEKEVEEGPRGDGRLREQAAPEDEALPLPPVRLEQGEHGRCAHARAPSPQEYIYMQCPPGTGRNWTLRRSEARARHRRGRRQAAAGTARRPPTRSERDQGLAEVAKHGPHECQGPPPGAELGTAGQPEHGGGRPQDGHGPPASGERRLNAGAWM